jgi:hypothetical protein
MDGLKMGEIKSPHTSHESGIMCTTQMKNLKIQKRPIDKQIELDSTKRRNVHNNERIKDSQ